MCASYGLDPRFDGDDYVEVLDAELLAGLRAWAEHNADRTLRPTGRKLRNLNPILVPGHHVSEHDAPTLENGWWGYLVDGEPASFPSINTRSERALQRPGILTGRAIVPATRWFEMQKPSRTWHSFGLEGRELLGLAAVTRIGRTSDGASFTCYSILMQPASESLAAFHDRMPVLISPDFALEWLQGSVPPRELLEAAIGTAGSVTRDLVAVPMPGRP